MSNKLVKNQEQLNIEQPVATKKLIYASDLDRTLIFSERFIKEYPSDTPYSPVEYKGIEIVSYMDDEVKAELIKLAKHPEVEFIPITSRSTEEYNRINLGFKPEYVVLASGGIILHNGEIDLEYAKYVKKYMNYNEALSILADVEDSLDSVNYTVKMIDNTYLFYKTDDPERYDDEVLQLMLKYPEWVFTRQNNKCYAIPKHISKQVALRWLWHKLGQPKIVASGDSELDLPMLSLADAAVIPKHGSLVKDGYVVEGNIVDGGIRSPLKTFEVVRNMLK